MTVEPVRFAVVGAVGYSRSHLASVRGCAERGRARLAASMMIDRANHPDLVAELEAAHVPVFDRYDDMLHRCQGQVDMVTLPVPIYLHASMTIAALEAGYHVLVEKPAAGSLAEVDAMIAARDRAGRHCAVGFQAIYSPIFQTLKQRIAEGRLGAVRRIRCMALWPRDPSYYGRNNWAGKLTCDGRPVYDSPFNNALAHQIMNLLYLASSDPEQAAYPVRVEAELFRCYPIESFDTGCMRAYTHEGVELLFVATHACAQNVNPIFQVEAEKAWVDIDFNQAATIHYADGAVETVTQGSPSDYEFDNLINALTGQAARPHCTLEMARAHTACIAQIHQNAAIRDIPPQDVSELPSGQRVIAGIDRAVQQCFDGYRLFSETDADWARA